MFIGHFALTPEPLVRLSWNFVLRILSTRGRSGANPIRPKNVGHPEDRPLSKGTEEHGGRRIIQIIICNILCSSVPLILVIWKSVLFANDHLQRNGGGRIIQMIICNNSCSSVPLILVIRKSALFANDHFQRNGGARKRPNHRDDRLQQSVLLRPLDFGHPENRPLCKWPIAKERRSTEEAVSSGWSFATIRAPLSSGGRLTSLKASLVRCFTFSKTSPKTSQGNVFFKTSLKHRIVKQKVRCFYTMF